VGILGSYLSGVHGEDFLAGGSDVPVCTDCHSEHSIEDPMLEGSSVSSGHVAETCARCHADHELAGMYGLPATALVSWGRSYHGIANALGDSRAANCASCHGFHEIYPSSDPRSSINPANLGETCGGCHGDAGAYFAQVPVHSVVDRDSNFVAWLVREVYLVLITATIGAFVLFILIDLFGVLRMRMGWGPPGELSMMRRPEEERELIKPEETFPRFSLQGRFQHGVLVASFLLLVLTGLPLFLHDLPLVRSIVDLEGGYELRGVLHRAGAFGLIGLSLWHLAYIALSRDGRRWVAAIMFRPRDVTQFAQEVMFNLGLMDWLSRRRALRGFFARHPSWAFRERPRYDRYSLVEKLEYGAVVWGNAVMIASGALLWKPGWFLGWVPVWAFEVGRVVHGFEATLAFLAIIIWHMYHVHLRPDVFPMSRVWLVGRISARELRHHHPLQYERILERRRAAAGPPESTPGRGAP
jgi:cytochrome b subunit of formate dehydrogenase